MMRWILLATLLPQAALAADVVVTVRGIEAATGQVFVAACAPADFPNGACGYKARVPARAGAVEARLTGLPEGRWGVSVFQDLDGDGKLGTDWLGRPKEPVGFGNDAPISRFGPPDFAASSVAVPASGEVRAAVTLRNR